MNPDSYEEVMGEINILVEGLKEIALEENWTVDIAREFFEQGYDATSETRQLHEEKMRLEREIERAEYMREMAEEAKAEYWDTHLELVAIAEAAGKTEEVAEYIRSKDGLDRGGMK
jgi:hypothetical protein